MTNRRRGVSRLLARAGAAALAGAVTAPLALTAAYAAPPLQPASPLATAPVEAPAEDKRTTSGPAHAIDEAFGADMPLPVEEVVEGESFEVLVFSKTAGFRHDSIPAGIAAIEQLGSDNGFAVTATEDASAFTVDNLANYDVVVWLSTTGDVLNEDQQAAFEAYIADGGGYAGVHAASDTEYDWAWYGDLVGAYFSGHPQNQTATINVADRQHPSTAHLPYAWERFDEWYSFGENPRGDVHVLAALDESTYDPGGNEMGADHPIAWCQDFDGGRSWYTGGGHTQDSYAEPAFLAHLLGGIQTAAGTEDADCSATVDESFEQVTLARGAANTGEPIAMAVLPNGDVVHTSRAGQVYYTTADASTSVAGSLPVYNHDEDGLQGVAIDPNFAENRWLYLYYAPVLDTPAGDAPETGSAADFERFEGYNQLSRFQLSEDGQLDLDSEQEILQVEADRGLCCHAGGEIDFDADGNLLLSTGDDTNPFASDGYTPIDERANRNPAFDAQRSSGNTNDLRGKLIRIAVQEDGSYTIPEGNLFEEGTELTRPEIYAMGFRNPFRFAVDQETGWIYLGDYGPDAGSANPSRGPGGLVEFNLIKEAGNYGWPFCIGDNEAFIDYDFATGQSGEAFDCANPVNTSVHNTGLEELPPAIPAWAPYDGGSNPNFGTGGESPMGGPTYRFDPELESSTKWPEYYDGKNFSYEWDRSWIREFLVDDDGALVDVIPALEWMDLRRPMNVEFGPDGAMYVLDYGGGYFGGDAQSAVYRIDYVAEGRGPRADITTSVTNGGLPLTVEFDGSGSADPNGGDLTYAWDFDGDGEIDSTEVAPTHTYTEPGVFTARLTVTGAEDRTGTATVNITVGNTAPEVTLEVPANGGIFSFGDQVPYEVTVTDAEDGEIDCSRVRVEYILGHDNHGHPLSSETGCSGMLTTASDDGHGLDANVFGVVNASYADEGAEGVPSLTADDEAVLRLRNQQAEFYTTSEGIAVYDKAEASGGRTVGNIEGGDWIAFDPLNLMNIEGLSIEYSSGGIGGTVEVRSGAADGPLVAELALENTGGWETFAETDVVDITDPGGEGPLYFVFVGGDGSQALFDLDVINYVGKGVADNTAPTVTLTADPVAGDAPLEVDFVAEGSDADGDAITYAWDFGDGATGEGAEVTHTYTELGTFTATVTVTDERGAVNTESVTISVGGTLPCEDPDAAVDANDEFSGSALDGCRWDAVNYTPDLLSVGNGTLSLTTTDNDIYNTPNTDVPNILRNTAVTGSSWTVDTMFTGALESQYQQGGIMVYGDDDNYIKLDPVFAGGDNPVRVELRSEIDGAIVGQGDLNELPPSPYGTHYLRLVRDGDTFTGQYSVDGINWVAVGSSVTHPGLADASPGLFVMGPQQQAPTTLSFDFFRVDGAEPPVCTASDEFEGTEIDDCRWAVVNPDPELAEVSDGALRITTTNDDIYGADNSAVPNILRSKQVTGDAWSVETKLTADLSQQYHQGGLIAYGDDGNYVKVGAIYTGNGDGPVGFEIRSEIDDSVQNPQPGSAAMQPSESGEYWVRLTRDGTTFVGSWSLDGESWTDLEAVSNDSIPGVGPGPFALGKNQSQPTTVAFDYVRFAGEDPEPPVCEPGEVEEGYTSLFDGTQQSLDAWNMAGPGSFELQEDCTALTVGGMGLLWYPEEFEQYSLKLDWKMAGDDNSGVFVGFPDPGDDPWVAVNEGYEIQIDATDADDRTTGAIYTFQGADLEARDEALNPPGEWNAYEIVVEGQNIKVYLNDVLINDFDSTEPSRDLSSGFIGLQNHGADDDVSFRNVRIAEIEAEEDVTAPAVEISGVADGDVLDAGTEVTVEATATDEESGVASLVLTLNGEEIDNPSTFTPPVGTHELVATATDEAGNVGEASVTFSVTDEVTFDSAEARIQEMIDDGSLLRSPGRQILTYLSTAARQAERGDASGAARSMDRFDAAVARVADADARAELEALSDALRDLL